VVMSREKKVIPGIKVEKTDKYLIATISELSEELKVVVRNRFSAICYGENYSLLKDGNYTYIRTVEEFLKRIQPKSSRVKTGMIGELIIHVVTGLVYPGYKTIVPYFNLEERNIKKGFDSVIYSADIGLWACEVKSSREETPTRGVGNKIKSLIKTAHNDLSTKLQRQDDVCRLWGNAMNGLQVACGHLKDEKEVLQQIILKYQEEARTPQCGPDRHNVILSSVLISGEELGVDSGCVIEKHSEYKETYNKLMIFAVHKSITIDLLEFFKQEAGG
jgi:hypothetical protein